MDRVAGRKEAPEAVALALVEDGERAEEGTVRAVAATGRARGAVDTARVLALDQRTADSDLAQFRRPVEWDTAVGATVQWENLGAPSSAPLHMRVRDRERNGR